jgi:uncharacterized FlaG/YvyC family protein
LEKIRSNLNQTEYAIQYKYAYKLEENVVKLIDEETEKTKRLK